MTNQETPKKQRGGKREGSGRKKMQPSEKVQTMSFTLSAQQLEEIRKQAKAKGVRTSEYIRQKIFDNEEPKKTGE